MMDNAKWRRYLAGQCSPTEKEEIVRLLHGLSPEALESLLAEGWRDDAPPMPVELERKVRIGLEAKLRGRKAGVHRLPFLFRWLAAACLLGLSGTVVWLLQKPRPMSADNPPVLAYHEIRNRSSVVQVASLPDGTHVWLTPQSSLQLEANFNIRERKVTLNGEGYFEVKADPHKPFSVIAGDLHTSVLGTHFDIEAYPGESTTTVSLTEGSVAVKGKDSSILLTPGIRLRYNTFGRQYIKEHIPAIEEHFWKSDAFALDDLMMPDAFRRVSLRFGKTIVFNENIFKRKRITAHYEHPTLPGILDNMAYVQGFTYTMQGDTVYIKPR